MLNPTIKTAIEKLVTNFQNVNDVKKSEEHIQSLFTIKLLEILGWESADFRINQGQDVKTGKKPDIILHNHGNTLIVIESKDASKYDMLDGYYRKPEGKITFVEQLQNYCKAEGVFWGILTNFIEWRVYAIYQNRLYMNKKYAFHKILWENADKQNYVDLLSENGFEFFDKLSKTKFIAAKGLWDDDTIYYPLQDDIREKFFQDLKTWRESIKNSISKHNSGITVNNAEYFAQKIINRMIFIDYCSDNKIISQRRLFAALESKSNIYDELKSIFADMDEKFDSELFVPNQIEHIIIPDEILKPIIIGLSNTDFSKLSVNVIGEVYEKYLGEMQRSGQGIYYTPEHIVDYIVQNTVGELLKKCKSVKEIENIKILDPACGSGSFLTKIFDEFLKHYKRFGDDSLFEFDLRRKILLNNIFGVDLDERAIEITKLNLLIKALEGAAHYDIVGKKILPNIKLNIRCGNSLVSGVTFRKDMSLFWEEFALDIAELEQLHIDFGQEQDEEKQAEIFQKILVIEESLNRNLNNNMDKCFSSIDLIKPFNYEVVYPDVFKNGGFDCVLGNPPYIDSERMVNEQPETRKFLAANMKYTKGNWDIYIAFFEKAELLTKQNGFWGFITPDKWISHPFGETLRKNTVDSLVSILRAGREVFTDAKVDAVVTLFQKNKTNELSVFETLPDSISLVTKIKKTKVKPKHEFDFLFSKYQELLLKMNDSANSPAGQFFSCENACATSDCYSLKDLIINAPHIPIDENKYYKLVNTGTISKYVALWDTKKMKYLKTFYFSPVVEKEKFHQCFANGYSKKVNTPKLILKGLTLLDAMIDFDGSYIPSKATLVVTAQEGYLEYFAALFNSKLAYFYISQRYPSSSYNGGISFTKNMINSFPVIIPNTEIRDSVITKVHEIINIRTGLIGLPKTDCEKKLLVVDSIQYELDAIFYKLYSLSRIDIEIVEREARTQKKKGRERL